MAQQNGIGVITNKGQSILAYITANGGSLDFQRFVLSSKQESILNLVNDEYANTNNKTYAQLISYLGSNAEYTGTVSAGEITPGDTTYPVLLTTPVSSIPTNTDIHTVFITVTDPNDSLEYVFWQGCLYYDDNDTTGDYTDDGNTIPFTYIAGTNLLLRISLEYTSGFPEDYTFINSQAIEIEEHNSLSTAHNSTLLRLDGSNSPTANMDFGGFEITNIGAATSSSSACTLGQISTSANASYDVNNFAELEATLSTFPPLVNHVMTINILATTNFGNAELNITDINGNGEIYINNTVAKASQNKLRSISINDCSANIHINNFAIDGDSGWTCLDVDNSRFILADDCELEGGTPAISATNNSLIKCTDIIIKGQNNTTAVECEYGSRVICGNMLHNAETDYTTGPCFIAQYGGTIYKPINFSDISVLVKSNGNEYSRARYGGEIYGYWGSGCSSFFNESTPANDDETYKLTISVGTTNAEFVNDALNQAGPHIPQNRIVDVVYANGSGGDYSLTNKPAGIIINGWTGEGLLRLTSSGTATISVTGINDNYQYLKCFDNSVNIEISNFSISGDTASVFYLKNNKGKVILDNVHGESINDSMFVNGCKVIRIEDCINIKINNSEFFVNGAPELTPYTDINLYADNSKVVLDNVILRDGEVGVMAINGAIVIGADNIRDYDSNGSAKYELYAYNGATIHFGRTLTSQYTYDNILKVSSENGGCIRVGDLLYQDGYYIDFSSIGSAE